MQNNTLNTEPIKNYSVFEQKIHPLILRQQLVNFLGEHNLSDLYKLVDQAVERRADIDTNITFNEYMHKYCQIQTHIKKHPLPDITNANIQRMENECVWLKKTIQNINLNHRERLYLAALYLRLGKVGENRLLQIMSTQENYNERKTKSIIEAFKRKGKSRGLSCQKIIYSGLCKEKECVMYGRGFTVRHS